MSRAPSSSSSPATGGSTTAALDSLRRALKTEAMAHKRELGKMMREGVLLTKERNTLRKNARSMQLQKKAIDATPEGKDARVDYVAWPESDAV